MNAPRLRAVAVRALIGGEWRAAERGRDHRSLSRTLIDEAAAKRLESCIDEASSQAARIVTGGHRHGAEFEPTLLTDVKPRMKVVCEEVFGPVVNVIAYDSLDEPFAAVNASPYGLHTSSRTAA